MPLDKNGQEILTGDKIALNLRVEATEGEDVLLSVEGKPEVVVRVRGDALERGGPATQSQETDTAKAARDSYNKAINSGREDT